MSLTQALELLLGSQLVKDKIQRNEHVIRILKQLGLNPDHPPQDFEGVYNYALVEYGVGKPQACLEIFRESEIRQVFRTAFDQNNAELWLVSGEQFLESSEIGDAVTELGLNPREELALFAKQFLEVAKRTRNPADVLLAHRVAAVQQTVQQMAGQLEAIASQGAIAGSDPALLQPSGNCRAAELGRQLREWFEILGYKFESYEMWAADYFEWVINIPVRRGRYDRVLVRGVDGEVGIKDVRSLSESVAAQKADEGWIVTARRISQAAKGELATADCEGLAAFTLDELLDQDADFSSYLDWLEGEIERRGIEAQYVPIACTKEEVDPVTHQRLGVSRYGEADGWTEGYIDRWLDDPAKEHLSVLGEFGTGKTWLTLHYAARAVRQYREAQAKGMVRPRLPIVVPLRDYAKAVSVESLFSEFFFRKHEIPIPGYSAFEQLNRMGKLLLIFDGFDEMAARVDKQQMINNFWELAKVVVPGSKVVLTCRTEHFPEAREGRSLLNAELQASTRGLSGETPQFEVLELEKFEDGQIRQVLALQASEATVGMVMGNPQLLDLARRPVMTELILEALPEIEAGKPVDMSRVYLYAVKRKMERDIKAERTFTSMADKLYFLCELSWEMLSNDRMSINYREFPDRIRKLFGSAVQEEKDLDHWHFDMMGQTMLIRNADGDYSPAHRSLLEFFVAFKFAAELGALAPDFLELAQMKSGIDRSLEPREYTWSEYFGGGAVAPLSGFRTESLEGLRSGFGVSPLMKAVIDLLVPMLVSSLASLTHPLFKNLESTRYKTKTEVGYTAGNIANLLLELDQFALDGKNLSNMILLGVNLTSASLRSTRFTNSRLKGFFAKALGSVLAVAVSPDNSFWASGDSSGAVTLWDAESEIEVDIYRGHTHSVRSLAFSSDSRFLASGSGDQTIRLWEIRTGKCVKVLKGHTDRVRSISFSPDSKFIASASLDKTIKLWEVDTENCIKTLKGHQRGVQSVTFSPDGKFLASGSGDRTTRLWSFNTGKCLRTFESLSSEVESVAFSPDGKTLASGNHDQIIKLWDLHTGECLATFKGHTARVWSIAFNSNGLVLASGSYDQTIKLWNTKTGECLRTLIGHTNWIQSIAFSPDDKILISGSDDQTIRSWNLQTGEALTVLKGRCSTLQSLAFSHDGKFVAGGGAQQIVRLLDSSTGECVQTLCGHTNWIHSVAFSPDSKILASSSGDLTIKVWDFLSGKCLKTLLGHTHWVDSVTFSPDGQILASGSYDNTVRIWDIHTGKCLKILKGHTGWVRSIVFSPDGQILASAGGDNTVKLWNISTGEAINTLYQHTSRVRSVSFSSDGQTIASASDDCTVNLWRIHTGECINILEGHTDWVGTVVFSPDNQILISGSEDGTIRFWSVHTGECLRILKGHSEWIRSIAIDSSNRLIASTGNSGMIRIWDIETGECLRTFSNRPYESMDITGVKGLTPTTIASLKALGAVEDEG